jgi:hypothetical protein
MIAALKSTVKKDCDCGTLNLPGSTKFIEISAGSLCGGWGGRQWLVIVSKLWSPLEEISTQTIRHKSKYHTYLNVPNAEK